LELLLFWAASAGGGPGGGFLPRTYGNRTRGGQKRRKTEKEMQSPSKEAPHTRASQQSDWHSPKKHSVLYRLDALM